MSKTIQIKITDEVYKEYINELREKEKCIAQMQSTSKSRTGSKLYRSNLVKKRLKIS